MRERRSFSVLKGKRGYSGMGVHTHLPMTSNPVFAFLPEPAAGLMVQVASHCPILLWLLLWSALIALTLASSIRTISWKFKVQVFQEMHEHSPLLSDFKRFCPSISKFPFPIN